ncbi:hypothetical protein [Bradyrhizobium sp. RT9a]|uniref:hypothetical protein n=1 Tax=Bradyrhizobium sp. RT9a TaxID=3156384 RepID=UPI003399FF86
MRKIILSLLLSLLVSSASAQIYFPVPLPAHTVIGNLNGVGGPANAVTMSELAAALSNNSGSVPDGTIRSNISGAPAEPTDNSISGVLDKLLGSTQGSIIYRGAGASGWRSLSPGTAGQFLATGGASANPSWASLPLSGLNASLGADVSLSSIGGYFQGPSIAQGTAGIWFVTATAGVLDTSGAAGMNCRISDGITVVTSVRTGTAGANAMTSLSLSGVITSPSGNLRLECADTTNAAGVMKFNASGNSKDTSITAVRIQ